MRAGVRLTVMVYLGRVRYVCGCTGVYGGVFQKRRRHKARWITPGLTLKMKNITMSLKKADRAVEMAQRLTALSALPEDLGVIPSIHMAAQNSTSWASDISRQNTNAHKISHFKKKAAEWWWVTPTFKRSEAGDLQA